MLHLRHIIEVAELVRGESVHGVTRQKIHPLESIDIEGITYLVNEFSIIPNGTYKFTAKLESLFVNNSTCVETDRPAKTKPPEFLTTSMCLLLLPEAFPRGFRWRPDHKILFCYGSYDEPPVQVDAETFEEASWSALYGPRGEKP